MMKRIIIFITIYALTSYSLASDTSYSVSHNHKSRTKDAIACDKYVRAHSNEFSNDMKALVSTYQKKEMDKTSRILEKYGKHFDSDEFFKNEFVHAVFKCSAVYKFSGSVNYYRELMGEMMYLLTVVNNTVNNLGTYHKDIYQHYESTIDNLNVILKSRNKTVNKSLNQSGASNAPPG